MHSDGSAAAPGWYPAQGDPPNTHRYWDGAAWASGPQPIVAIPPSPVATTGFPGPPPQPVGHQWDPVEPVDRNPLEWFVYVVKEKYAAFDGRASRAEFWWFTLIYTALLIVPVAAIFAISGATDGESSLVVLPILLLAILVLGLLIPNLAVTCRRLHDTGKSGKWYFITFVPYIGGLILFILLAIDGERGSNQYGPDPKGLQR